MARARGTAGKGAASPTRLQAAAAVFRSMYHREPDRIDVVSVAAELAVRDGDDRAAAELFGRIPSDDPRYGRSARHQQGEVLLRLDRAVAAERNLREFLRLEEADPRSDPANLTDARQRLRYILEIELRFAERQELLRGMVEQDEADEIDTIFYCFPDLLRWNGAGAVAQCERFLANDPADPHLRAAMGRYRAAQGRTEEARADLERLCRDRPDDLFAAGALLYCLHEQADWAAMGRALGPLPPPVKGEPWVLTLMRGRYANHMKRFAEAVACFELLLADDPASASAYAGLAAADAGLGKTEERLEALRRGRVLSLIQGQLGAAQQAPGDPKPLARLAELCGEIGLEPHSRLMRGLAERAAGRDAGSRGDSDAAATRRDPASERGEEVTNVPQGTKAENDAP